MKSVIRLLVVISFTTVITSCGSLNFFHNNQRAPVVTPQQPVSETLPPPAPSTGTDATQLPTTTITTPEPTSNVIPVMKQKQAVAPEPTVDSSTLTAVPPKKKKIVPLNGSTSEPVSDKPNTE